MVVGGRGTLARLGTRVFFHSKAAFTIDRSSRRVSTNDIGVLSARKPQLKKRIQCVKFRQGEISRKHSYNSKSQSRAVMMGGRISSSSAATVVDSVRIPTSPSPGLVSHPIASTLPFLTLPGLALQGWPFIEHSAVGLPVFVAACPTGSARPSPCRGASMVHPPGPAFMTTTVVGLSRRASPVLASRPATALFSASAFTGRALPSRHGVTGPAVGGGGRGAPQRRALHATPLSMKLQTGLVGMPNVGKSTLFNALVENAAAQAANFPFCTVEPNKGIVGVPDPRLDVLSVINKSVKVVPTSLEFVDIAGLVAGASKGEGLGNKFLANIRECDAIVHVVRCFEDENIIHVDGSVDPLRDIEVINLELQLADLAQVERRQARVKVSRGKSDATPEEISALDKLAAGLDEGKSARACELSDDEADAIAGLMLLTMKPVVYAANVADGDLAEGNAMVESVRTFAKAEGSETVVVSAQVESELIALSAEERAEFLDALGATEETTGLRALIKATYDLLGLRTYFTSGPTETRAWTITAGMKAPAAAGVIHTDFERGFIRAETVSYEDLVDAGSEKAAKEKGLLRSEGKEYVVKEADVMLFRFNV